MKKIIALILILFAWTFHSYSFQFIAGRPTESSCTVPSSPISEDGWTLSLSSSDYVYAQSFVACQDATEADITVWIAEVVGTPGANTEVRLKENDWDLSSGATCSVTSQTISATGSHTFYLTGCTITNTNTYMFGIRNGNDTSNDYKLLQDATSPTYADGAYHRGGSGSWNASTDDSPKDLRFTVVLR